MFLYRRSSGDIMENRLVDYDFTALTKELKKGEVKACIIMSNEKQFLNIIKIKRRN
jgi:hypothetical protein